MPRRTQSARSGLRRGEVVIDSSSAALVDGRSPESKTKAGAALTKALGSFMQRLADENGRPTVLLTDDIPPGWAEDRDYDLFLAWWTPTGAAGEWRTPWERTRKRARR